MQSTRTPAIAVLVVLAAGLAACGTGSSESAGPGSDAPDGASRTAFCGSLAKLTGKASPKQAAGTLGSVGTPSDIGPDARQGFEVLLARLRDLPRHAGKGDITQMARGLSGTEQQDVAAFIAYYARECRGLRADPAS